MGSVTYTCGHSLYHERITDHWRSEVECPDCAVQKVMEIEQKKEENVREYTLYNTDNEELEDFQYMTREDADILNKELRDKGEPQRWILPGDDPYEED
jgi:hypothetical protein